MNKAKQEIPNCAKSKNSDLYLIKILKNKDHSTHCKPMQTKSKML